MNNKSTSAELFNRLNNHVEKFGKKPAPELGLEDEDDQEFREFVDYNENDADEEFVSTLFEPKLTDRYISGTAGNLGVCFGTLVDQPMLDWFNGCMDSETDRVILLKMYNSKAVGSTALLAALIVSETDTVAYMPNGLELFRLKEQDIKLVNQVIDPVLNHRWWTKLDERSNSAEDFDE